MKHVVSRQQIQNALLALVLVSPMVALAAVPAGTGARAPIDRLAYNTALPGDTEPEAVLADPFAATDARAATGGHPILLALEEPLHIDSPGMPSLFDMSLAFNAARFEGDGNFTSPFGSGVGDLGKDGSSLSLEFRYRFLRQQLAGLYLFGGYEYFNSLDRRNLFLRLHFGAGPDSGVGMRLRDSWRLGLGYAMLFNGGWGLGFMAGLHYTNLKAEAISDESSGGGSYNLFQNTDNILKPLVGLEVSHTLPRMFGHNTEVFLRGERKWLSEVSASGTSSFTGATYTGRVDADHVDSVGIGVRIGF
jgi:hypothetical protein